MSAGEASLSHAEPTSDHVTSIPIDIEPTNDRQSLAILPDKSDMSAGETNLISHAEPISDQSTIPIDIEPTNDRPSLLTLPNNTDQKSKNFNITKSIFYTVLTANYILLILLLLFHTHNACHVLSWLGSICATTYVLLVFHTLLFSEQLCFHTVDYKPMKGSNLNLLPSEIKVHSRWPYETICHIAHVRGSTVHKWHTSLVGYGSLFLFCVAIIKIFEAHNNNDNHNLYTNQQVVAMYLLLIATFGGILSVNFEIYASPSFSKRWNCMTRGIHLFGGACYGILGNLSFAVYNNFNFISCLLLFCMLTFAVVYKIYKGYQYKKRVPIYDEMIESEDEYDEWVHRMSQINVGLEVIGLFIAIICMDWLGYQLGDHSIN